MLRAAQNVAQREDKTKNKGSIHDTHKGSSRAQARRPGKGSWRGRADGPNELGGGVGAVAGKQKAGGGVMKSGELGVGEGEGRGEGEGEGQGRVEGRGVVDGPVRARRRTMKSVRAKSLAQARMCICSCARGVCWTKWCVLKVEWIIYPRLERVCGRRESGRERKCARDRRSRIDKQMARGVYVYEEQVKQAIDAMWMASCE